MRPPQSWETWGHCRPVLEPGGAADLPRTADLKVRPTAAGVDDGHACRPRLWTFVGRVFRPGEATRRTVTTNSCRPGPQTRLTRSQGDEGVDGGGAAGGDVAGRKRDDRQEQRHADETRRVLGADADELALDDRRDEKRTDGPDHYTDERQPHALHDD